MNHCVFSTSWNSTLSHMIISEIYGIKKKYLYLLTLIFKNVTCPTQKWNMEVHKMKTDYGTCLCRSDSQCHPETYWQRGQPKQSPLVALMEAREWHWGQNAPTEHSILCVVHYSRPHSRICSTSDMANRHCFVY